ncbi:hypothetical protein PM082_002239 [Marasmius tenuissimus]|nr:hypothetical protein PM082_002239 [Marasmius tenuissimus]
MAASSSKAKNKTLKPASKAPKSKNSTTRASKSAKSAVMGENRAYSYDELLAIASRIQDDQAGDGDSVDEGLANGGEENKNSGDNDEDFVMVNVGDADTGDTEGNVPMSTFAGEPGVVSLRDPGDTDVEMPGEESEETVESLKAAVKKLQEDRDALKAKFDTLETSQRSSSSQQGSDEVLVIPRPSGVAGKHFSIQIAMGLAGSKQKDMTYRGLQRCVHDHMGFARIGYELAWRDISPKTKADLFESIRADQPYLARFQNNWATEKLAKQYLKNKRKTAYKHGWLTVPEKFAYLKKNAQARSLSGSRGSKAKAIREAREQKKAGKAARSSGLRRENQPADVNKGLVAPHGNMVVVGQE